MKRAEIGQDSFIEWNKDMEARYSDEMIIFSFDDFNIDEVNKLSSSVSKMELFNYYNSLETKNEDTIMMVNDSVNNGYINPTNAFRRILLNE